MDTTIINFTITIINFTMSRKGNKRYIKLIKYKRDVVKLKLRLR